MRGLSWIIAANALAAARANDNGDNWEVKLERELVGNVGQPGIVHVRNRLNDSHFTVDVSDPHNCGELLALHRRSDIPSSVKQRVEAFASQHRRIVCRAA